MLVRLRHRSSLWSFSLRGLLAFICLSSIIVMVTRTSNVHVETKSGDYHVAEIAKIQSTTVNNENARSPTHDTEAFKRFLIGSFRNESEKMLRTLMDYMRCLSQGESDCVAENDDQAGLKDDSETRIQNEGQLNPSSTTTPTPVPERADSPQLRKTEGLTQIYINPPEPLWPNEVRTEQNLTKNYWNRDWRSTIPLDSKAKAYLEGFEVQCANHDSLEKVRDRRRTANATSQLPLCPCVPATLVGRVIPDKDALLHLTWKDTESLAETVWFGGYWKPPECLARRRIAVIIPCRDRETQLRALMVHMHPLLQRHLVEYRIFVVEQEWPQIYNKASSMNAGFLEAAKMMDFDCVMFHDVDLLAEDDRSVVYCGDQPRHYGAYLDKWNYTTLYKSLFGGVTVLTKNQFIKTNGFSNVYFGWGGEDDDFEKRMRKTGFSMDRPPMSVSRHSSVRHSRDRANPVNPDRHRMMKRASSDYKIQGLNSVSYTITDIFLEPLFTWIRLNLYTDDIRNFRSQGNSSSQKTEMQFQYFKIHGSCREGDPQTPAVLSEASLSEVTCRYECDLDTRCRSFIYYRLRENHCVMLSGLCRIDSHVSDTTVHIKASKPTEYDYTVFNGDCFGRDIVGLRLTVAECRMACDSRLDCAGFVYAEKLKRQCWLKKHMCSGSEIQWSNRKLYTKYKKIR